MKTHIKKDIKNNILNIAKINPEFGDVLMDLINNEPYEKLIEVQKQLRAIDFLMERSDKEVEDEHT